MPLGKTQYLAIDTMAGNDTNKYLVFNDAVEALDDAQNRSITLDLSAGDVTLTETQLTRYGAFYSTGNTVARTLYLPATVSSPPTATNRKILVRNTGTFILVVDFVGSPGASASVAVGDTVVIYGDGTDIVVVAGGSNAGVQVDEEGVGVVTATEINFVGSAVTVTDVGGVATVTVSASSSSTMNVEVTAAEALGAYRAVTVSGNLCDSTQQDLSSYGGITTTAAIFGETVALVKEGLVTEGTWTWTPNLPIFVSTSGVLTQTAPALPLRRIGYAISATQVNFDPFPTIGA